MPFLWPKCHHKALSEPYYFLKSASGLINSCCFQQDVLNCTVCIDPGTYGRRTDPWGDYVRKFIPELANIPVEYIYEPWTAPIEVQEKAKCLIGKDYPERIVIHEEVSVRNTNEMNKIKDGLLKQLNTVSYNSLKLA